MRRIIAIVLSLSIVLATFLSIYSIADIGALEQATHPSEKNRMFVTVLVTGYLVLALYYFISFLQRVNDRYQLYFSLFCFVQGIYLATFLKQLFFYTQIGYIHVSLLVIMTMSLAILMGCHYSSTYVKAEQLSKDLLMYDQLKDEFLRKTSQELQAPLQSILTISQSLMEGKDGSLRLKQHENVMAIHNLSKRLSMVVGDLLDVSTSKQAGRTIYPTPVDLSIINEVLEEIYFLLPPSYPVLIRNEVTEDVPSIYVDKQKFKQIIFNILDNAIKYTTQGSIVISAEVHGRDMHIFIKDTGIGIQKEYLKLVFSSFFQVENISNRKGLGVGLTRAKQLVELSGGTISVTSQFGQGSCFSITLPLAMNDLRVGNRTPAINMKLPLKITGERNFTILVVDDDHGTIQLLVELIGSLQCTVIAVDKGEQALEIVKNNRIDLMILDLLMPGMSGYEVCEVLRREYSMIELPIILLTEGAQAADVATSMAVEANGFLRKPIHSGELQAEVESLLAMKIAAQMAIHDELSYFYAQIAPHFLYNTLNSIIALSYKDGEKTRDALVHLSTYFRAKLDFYNHESMISLAQEMELVQSYVAIEQMRFGERLTVLYAIDENVRAYLPAMTIQPLVENSIRHGLSKKDGGGTLEIRIRQEDGRVHIIVKDDGVGISEEQKQALVNERTTGIGFVNSFNKLKLMKNAQFILESEVGQGTKITIILPGVKNDEGRFN